MSKCNNALNESKGQIHDEEILTKEYKMEEAEEKFDITDQNAGTMKSIDEILFDDFERKLEEEEDVNLEDLEQLSNEEVSLERAVQDYQSGYYEAFDYLYNYYKPIFDRVSYRHNDEDLSQELSVVLYRAALTYDITAGEAKFNTYYWKCARNHMGTLRIRKNAKKRTAEYGIVSIQQSFNTKDSDVELEAFIEDPDCDKTYNHKIFQVILEEKVYPFLKEDEIIAVKMLMQGFTLEEIGKKLGGITAPAVHVKFRRLANKKNVGKQLQELYQLFGS